MLTSASLANNNSVIFELLPTIDIMCNLYRESRNFDRFKKYLTLLHGNTKGDLALPISGFNPMAKDHIIEKLKELKKLHCENIINDTLQELNRKFVDHPAKGNFKVALNLLDDLKGGWTSRYTSDYDSKFKINALLKRNFCTPIFWSDEQYTTALIRKRTLQYALRAVYRLTNTRPKTLEEHLKQEVFVAKHSTELTDEIEILDVTFIESFYSHQKDSDNYHGIFNFFYGDTASRSLGLPCYGISSETTGYDYAIILKDERAIPA